MRSSIPDIELWTAFTSGDREAFSTLFRRFYPLLYQYGSKIVADSQVVEDTIQDLFADLWQRPPVQELQSVKAYLLQALKFKLYRTFRNKLTVITDPENEALPFELSHEAEMIGNEQNEAQAKMIYAALEQLSPRQKEVIYLKIYKGLSYQEVSEVMQINYQVVRNLLCTALKAFKKLCQFLVITSAILFA